MKAYWIPILCSALWLGACANKSQKFTIQNRALLSDVQCIAIFPFENISPQEKAGAVMGRIMENALMASNRFAVMETGEVQRVMQAQQIDKKTLKDPAEIRKLGGQLRVDGVLTGTVKDFGYMNKKKNDTSDPYVASRLVLYHMPSGDTIWTADIERSSHDMNSRNRDPVSRVAMLAAEESVSILKKYAGQTKLESSKCGWIDPEL